MRRAAALGALVTGTFVAAAACTSVDYQCAGAARYWGAKPGEGRFLSEDTWESNRVEDCWLEFGANTIWYFTIPRWQKEGRELLQMHTYYSQDPRPMCSGGACDTSNSAEVMGNMAEYKGAFNPGQIWVQNQTCAHYYGRVVLRAGPPTLGTDAGALASEPASVSPVCPQ